MTALWSGSTDARRARERAREARLRSWRVLAHYVPGQEDGRVRLSPAYVRAAARAAVMVSWLDGRDAAAHLTRLACAPQAS